MHPIHWVERCRLYYNIGPCCFNALRMRSHWGEKPSIHFWWYMACVPYKFIQWNSISLWLYVELCDKEPCENKCLHFIYIIMMMIIIRNLACVILCGSLSLETERQTGRERKWEKVGESEWKAFLPLLIECIFWQICATIPNWYGIALNALAGIKSLSSVLYTSDASAVCFDVC